MTDAVAFDFCTLGTKADLLLRDVPTRDASLLGRVMIPLPLRVGWTRRIAAKPLFAAMAIKQKKRKDVLSKRFVNVELLACQSGLII
jgi:hypothetical protein